MKINHPANCSNRRGAPRRPNTFAALCLAIASSSIFVATGCRSSNPMNLFARKGPSPEALAGTGPTTTYPAPPSQSAKPQAIASIAGGTAKPKTPGSSPNINYAAASANGFPASPVGYRTENALASGTTKDPIGVSTGVKTAAATGSNLGSPSSPAPAVSNPAAPAGIQLPSGYGFAAKPDTPPSNAPIAAGNASKPVGMAFPPIGNSPSPSPATTAASQPASQSTGGFAFPPGMELPKQISSPMPTSSTPVAQTAAINVPPPAASPIPATIAPGGYSPGSTRAISGGYPGATATPPRSGGSFYR